MKGLATMTAIVTAAAVAAAAAAARIMTTAAMQVRTPRPGCTLAAASRHPGGALASTP